LIGVKVDLRVVDFATWRDLNFSKKDFDVFYNAYGSALDPDDTEYAKYHSGTAGNLVGWRTRRSTRTWSRAALRWILPSASSSTPTTSSA
jgi:ABC-type transport system substrate-binding protein